MHAHRLILISVLLIVICAQIASGFFFIKKRHHHHHKHHKPKVVFKHTRTVQHIPRKCPSQRKAPRCPRCPRAPRCPRPPPCPAILPPSPCPAGGYNTQGVLNGVLNYLQTQPGIARQNFLPGGALLQNGLALGGGIGGGLEAVPLQGNGNLAFQIAPLDQGIVGPVSNNLGGVVGVPPLGGPPFGGPPFGVGPGAEQAFLAGNGGIFPNGQGNRITYGNAGTGGVPIFFNQKSEKKSKGKNKSKSKGKAKGEAKANG